MSATGLVRLVWRSLWEHPTVFNLVFWSLMIALLVDWVMLARLAPLLPNALANPRFWTSPDAMSRASRLLAPAAGWRLGVFGLAVLLVVTPFRIAGLYGGVWDVLERPTPLVSPFQFFASARHRFWRGFAATVLGLLLALVVGVLFAVLSAVASWVGVIVGLLLVVFAVVLAWIGLGTLMAEPDRPAWGVVGVVLRTAARRWWDCLRFGLLAIGLGIASTVVLEVMASVPVLGTIVTIVFIGLLTGLTAVLPSVLYRTWVA
jgi:hypothetical protein